MYFVGGPGTSASSTTPASDTESEGNSEPILSMQRGTTSEKMDTGDGGVEKTEETLHGFADHLIDESDEDIPVRRTVNVEAAPLQKVEEKSSLAGTLMLDASKTLVLDSDDDDDDDENRRKTNEETRASSSTLEASKTLVLESDDDDDSRRKPTEKTRDTSLTLEACKTLILDSDDDNDDGRKTTKDSSLDGASIQYQAKEESNKPSSKSDSGDDDLNEAGSSILDAFLSESGRKGMVTDAGNDSVAETQAYRYESDPDEKEEINEGASIVSLCVTFFFI